MEVGPSPGDSADAVKFWSSDKSNSVGKRAGCVCACRGLHSHARGVLRVRNRSSFWTGFEHGMHTSQNEPDPRVLRQRSSHVKGINCNKLHSYHPPSCLHLPPRQDHARHALDPIDGIQASARFFQY